MKTLQRTSLLLLLLAASACQSSQAARPDAAPEMGMPTPVTEHMELQKSVGDWSGMITMHMPDGSEQVSEASESVRANGPFWVITELQMDMGPMGLYQGHGTNGFDAERGKYIATWSDSMSSTLSLMEGEHDAAKGGVVMRWRGPDQMGQLIDQSSLTTRTDDAYTMTFYMEGVKSMTISMKRKMDGNAK